MFRPLFGAREPANPQPTVFDVGPITRESTDDDSDDSVEDPIDALEIFDIIRDIYDPEYPYTLSQLKVMKPSYITIHNRREIDVTFKPTIAQCSMATLIGLSIRVKLMRSLPRTTKLRILLYPESHLQERLLNKQLNDKERVCAALENPALLRVVNSCLRSRSGAA